MVELKTKYGRIFSDHVLRLATNQITTYIGFIPEIETCLYVVDWCFETDI